MANKPVQKFRAGGITATVWENEQDKDGKKFSFHTVNVERSYTDKDGKWQTTSSMRVNDLPRLQVVCSKAFEYLTLKEEQSE